MSFNSKGCFDDLVTKFVIKNRKHLLNSGHLLLNPNYKINLYIFESIANVQNNFILLILGRNLYKYDTRE